MGYLVEEIPLSEFYDRFRPELVRSGFSALIMALIRDADAPTFYDDVVRYWSSLSDVTGDDFIFLVAGERPLLRSKLAIQRPTGQVETEALLTPARLGEPMNSNKRSGWKSIDINASDRPRDRNALADSNTQQIGQLCQKLRISEQDVPCFYIEILSPIAASGTIPARDLIEYGTYHVVKRIVEKVRSLFENWGWHSNHRRELAEVGRRLAQLEADYLTTERSLRKHRLGPRELARHKTLVKNGLERVKAASANLQEAGQSFASSIIAHCHDEGRSVEEKKHLLFLARRASRQGVIDIPTKRAIDELINASFSNGHLKLLDSQHHPQAVRELQEAQLAFDRVGPELERHKHLVRELSQPRALINRDPENDLSTALAELNRELSSGVERTAWDYFISYPAADRDKAIALFQRYSVAGPTFMDWFCLKPGDEWLKKIPEVQSRSEATVALVTENTAQAHFQLSEINRAITFARSGRHRVIPHLTSQQIELPFGLELYHAEVMD